MKTRPRHTSLPVNPGISNPIRGISHVFVRLVYRASLVNLENLPEDRKFISPEKGRRIYDVKGFESIYFQPNKRKP